MFCSPNPIKSIVYNFLRLLMGLHSDKSREYGSTDSSDKYKVLFYSFHLKIAKILLMLRQVNISSPEK